MADFSCTGLDDLMLSMAEIAEIPDDVQDNMLNAQADVVVRAQQSKASSYGVQDSGKTAESITKGKVKSGKNGRVIHVYPKGTRTRGKTTTRNAEIAFIAEFGKKGQSARPFIRDANESSAAETTQAAFTVYGNWLKSKNL